MNKYYFTFGEGQSNHGKYVVIEATSSDIARKRIFDKFGSKWSFEYTEDEWYENGIPQHETYKYEEIKI